MTDMVFTHSQIKLIRCNTFIHNLNPLIVITFSQILINLILKPNGLSMLWFHKIGMLFQMNYFSILQRLHNKKKLKINFYKFLKILNMMKYLIKLRILNCICFNNQNQYQHIYMR